MTGPVTKHDAKMVNLLCSYGAVFLEETLEFFAGEIEGRFNRCKEAAIIQVLAQHGRLTDHFVIKWFMEEVLDACVWSYGSVDFDTSLEALRMLVIWRQGSIE